MSREPTPSEILDRVSAVQADTAGVMEASRWAEWLLEHRFGASGTGIHTRVNSVQHLLSDALVADLRYLASVRNDFAHNPMATVRAPDRFTQTAQRAVRQLLETPTAAAAPRRQAGPAPAARVGRPRNRAAFAAIVAGFWALAMAGFSLFNRGALPEAGVAQPPEAAPAAQVAPPRQPQAEQPARPAAARAPRARPAPEPAEPPSPATPAQADASPPPPVESGLSVDDLRKLKQGL